MSGEVVRGVGRGCAVQEALPGPLQPILLSQLGTATGQRRRRRRKIIVSVKTNSDGSHSLLLISNQQGMHEISCV